MTKKVVGPIHDGAAVYAQKKSTPAKGPVSHKKVMESVGVKPKRKPNIVQRIANASPQAQGINLAERKLRAATKKK